MANSNSSRSIPYLSCNNPCYPVILSVASIASIHTCNGVDSVNGVEQQRKKNISLSCASLCHPYTSDIGPPTHRLHHPHRPHRLQTPNLASIRPAPRHATPCSTPCKVCLQFDAS